MARIYVAYRTDNDESARLASGSATIIKQRIREVGESEWTVAVYDIKPNVANLCQIIEDLSEVEAEEADNYKVTASGQVRKVD